MNDENTPPVAPPTGPAPDHIRIPHARPIQPIPVSKDGQQFVALRDPAMLVNQSMVVNPGAMGLVQQFQGELAIEDIADKFVPVDQVQDPEKRSEIIERLTGEIRALAEGMDKFGLLWGPTFNDLENKRAEALATAGAFPVSASGSLVMLAQQLDTESEPPSEDSDKIAWARDLTDRTIQKWLEEAEDPEFDTPPMGLVVPHLDYSKAHEVYASAYRSWDGVAAPDRVVILGTNHFGMGDGVVMSRYGFDTPLGRVRPDTDVVEKLGNALGDRLFKDELDLAPEHSIELHLPFIQKLFGDVPVVAALMPDPTQPLLEDDGGRVSWKEFVDTCTGIISESGGVTYFVASADLSHVGPQFGEPKAVDSERKEEVERHDREMIGHYLANNQDSFIEAMEWSKNPTHWCSIGNMEATAKISQVEDIELLDYRQAVDDQGTALVSVASIALFGAES